MSVSVVGTAVDLCRKVRKFVGSGAQSSPRVPPCVGALEERRLFAVEYTIVDLGSLGGRNTFVHGINDLGDAVGDSNLLNSTAYHAFVYRAGALSDIGTLGGTTSFATDINNSGQIVGEAKLAGEATRPFLYENGRMISLGTLGGGSGQARGINSRGQVVGAAGTPQNTSHAFLYDAGAMLDLGTLGGETAWRWGSTTRGPSSAKPTFRATSTPTRSCTRAA